MPLSQRFKDLNSRLNELRRNLLPTKFSVTGDYTDMQKDRARGYRLLAHAEIESYIEDIARSTVTEAIRLWKKNGESSKPLIALLASYHSGWSASDDVANEKIIQLAKSRTKIKESVDEIIELAQTQFLNRVKDNHGIKENNFYVLILPTGVDTTELDSTWITNLNNFGSLRGEVAHKTKFATREINPKDELDTVRQLIIGLQDLDDRLCKMYKSSIIR